MACCTIRWRAVSVVIGGILVHLTLGTVYSFGNLTPYLTSYLRNSTARHDLTYSDSVWIYACALMGQGLAIFLGGFIGRRFGVRKTTILGSWFMSAGVALTYFTIQHSYIGTIFTYGVINGLGVGVGYPMPMACAMKWMPERKGLAGGLVVAGFGGGAFIFNFIQTAFINPGNLSPDLEVNGEKFFTQTELLDRVPWAFLLTGGIYATMQLIGVILLRDPPIKETHPDKIIMTAMTSTDIDVSAVKGLTGTEEGTDLKLKSGGSPSGSQDVKDTEARTESNADVKPGDSPSCSQEVKDTEARMESDVKVKSGDIPGDIHQENSGKSQDLTPLQVLRTRAFYTLWFCFLFNGQGIVVLSSLYKDYGQTFIKDDVFLAAAGSFAAVFNFSGRMFWGFLADRFSFKTAMLCLCAAFTCLIITFNATGYGGKPVFFIYMCLLFGTLSGNYPLFSLAAAQTFGQTHYAVTFGFIFTSQTITGPLGAILSSQLKTQIGWFGMFSLVAAFSFLSLILIATFPERQRRNAPT